MVIDDPLITRDQLYLYSAITYAQMACYKCNIIYRRKIISFRVSVKKNGDYQCFKCIQQSEEYKTKQQINHSKMRIGSKWNAKVDVKCDICTNDYKINYRSLKFLERNNKSIICQSCVNKKIHADGKYTHIYNEEFCRKLFKNGKNFYNNITQDQRQFLSECGKKPWINDIYKEQMATIRSNQSGKLSKPQAALYQVLDDLKINYYKEGPKTRIIKTRFPFDCVIPIQNNMKKNLIIEVQSYWHTFPRKKATDQAKFTIIDRHFPNYQMMYIWEKEFSNKNLVIERLKATLEIDIIQNDFEFDNVIITDHVPFIDYRSFLDAYHYVGKNGRKILGAYLNNRLIACMVYNIKSSRLYIHPCYRKNNFVDWFMSKRILVA